MKTRMVWTEDHVAFVRAWFEVRRGHPAECTLLASLLGVHKANLTRKLRSIGITRDGRDVRSEAERSSMRARALAWHRVNVHPKGATGMRHSAETRKMIGERAQAGRGPWTEEQRAKLSKSVSQSYASGKRQGGGFSRARAGRRPDIGRVWFRSAWEANIARVLNARQEAGEIASWVYEPQRFSLPLAGVTYLPDFAVSHTDGRVEYVEVKGWMTEQSRARIDAMRAERPDLWLSVIGASAYRMIEREWAPRLPIWESSRHTVRPRIDITITLTKQATE